MSVSGYEMVYGEQVGSGPQESRELRASEGEGSSYLHRKGNVISLTSFLPGLALPPRLILSLLNDRISFHLGEMGSRFPGVHVALCESAAARAQHPG